MAKLLPDGQNEEQKVVGNCGRPSFYHHPLDQKENSIRLVRLLSDLSTDGLVQCNIWGCFQLDTQRATNTPTPYVCLSYTWGSPGDEAAILIDGKMMMVRKNLKLFLQVAKTQLTYCFLWIDALCIDQANAAERDHQVQQMGTIFAKAKMLITWLGCEPELEQYLDLLGREKDETQWKACRDFYQREHRKTSLQDYVPLTSGISTALSANATLEQAKMLAFYVTLADHGYWKRAWVTQEIMLAKAIYTVAGRSILDYPSLVNATRSCAYVHPESHFEQFARLMLVQKDYFTRKDVVTGRVLISDSWMNNWGLVNLLHHFEDKCCTVRRDMVYSVLSLSREAEALRVNYQSPTSEVLWQIMSICKDSVCLCTAAVLVRALGEDSFVDTEPRLQTYTPFVDIPIFGFRPEHLGSTTRCPFCNSRLRFAGRSTIELLFCLPTACKDSDGHVYEENVDGYHLLRLELSCEREAKSLGHIGKGIEITQDDNGDAYLLKLSLPSLLRVVGGPQWGRTLKKRCGNLWPHKDRPSSERLCICTA